MPTKSKFTDKEMKDAIKSCKYNITEAAKKLGVSRQAIYWRMNNG